MFFKSEFQILTYIVLNYLYLLTCICDDKMCFFFQKQHLKSKKCPIMYLPRKKFNENATIGGVDALHFRVIPVILSIFI